MSALGLGRVKTPCLAEYKCVGVLWGGEAQSFFGFDYALIAAMSGLSGSTIVEDGVLMGGGVGTSGHLTIGAGSVVHGRAAVTKNWAPGSKLAGAPAQDIRDFWREIAAMRKLSKGDKRG